METMVRELRRRIDEDTRPNIERRAARAGHFASFRVTDLPEGQDFQRNRSLPNAPRAYPQRRAESIGLCA